jgi:putative heme-binding domain-containing protein
MFRTLNSLGIGLFAASMLAAQLAAAAEPAATPLEQIKVLPGFQVELLYSVPKEQEGSWVNMCVDPQGRLIVSDQHGGLYRVVVAPIDGSLGFNGIGATLQQEGLVTKVMAIVPGGAADRDSRIRVGDRIHAIARGAGEWQEIDGLELAQVVDLLRGPVGIKQPQTLRLKVQHEGDDGVREVDLTTSWIEVPEWKAHVEHLPLDIGEAQGLLWAFDSLYVVVNKGGKYESGLYRCTDSDGDSELDTVTQLRRIDGGGEHGPHAVLLSPDGQSLYIVCGNNTRLPELEASRVPRVWDEDILLPRLYGKGFMRGIPAPGGFIAKTDPEGKSWELIATGFRNEFDAAFNRDGELFAYDADMEWDFNTPWYRPTRINHVVSGAEFGWRNGSGKWPAWSPDSLPAAVDIGPGSPTGVCFGYGAKFPQKYQEALFACDWSYGKLYAVHLEAKGSSYGGTFEEFISGTPLPLTDVVINPHDGAMYFTIGGRKVQSGLYRVTARDDVPSDPDSQSVRSGADDATALRALRRELETLHKPTEGAVERAWPHLGHADRFVRFAARIAIEHQPVEQWHDRALAKREPAAALTALLALARQQQRPQTLRNDIHDPVVPANPGEIDLAGVDLGLKSALFARLAEFDWSQLSPEQRISLLRLYTVILCRMGPPDEETRAQLISRFDSMFPAGAKELNSQLCALLVYLQAPSVAAKTIALLQSAPTQEEQIDYSGSLRFLKSGWNDDLLHAYTDWLVAARDYRGGANFAMFMDDIRKDARTLLNAEQRLAFRARLDAAAKSNLTDAAAAPRPVVRKWTMDDVLPLVESGLHGRDFDRGRKLFGEARCFTCHRFDNDGGAMGPDLTSLAGRFSRRDILEAVLDPSKVISDQYASVQIVTRAGKVVVGRIVNLNGSKFQVNTDMADPNALTEVDRDEIEEMQPSKVSMMPQGLLDTLHEDEVLDLLAYLLSRGDRESEMFALAGEAGTSSQNVNFDENGPQPPEGFRPLFNGRDLTGWHGMTGFDPRELAKLSEEERKAKIDEWTADAKQHWSVENGELVNDGHGAYLTTDEEFGDYELLIDYKTVALADSGIYLKYTPQVQIWDFTEAGGKWNLGADKGSGGLWNNSPGAPGKDPLVLADKPFGEWNSFRIRQVGARTSVWLNGQLVVDHAPLENLWDRAVPLVPRGGIQLQTHGGEIRWRNIFVREIPAEEANTLFREKSGSGFTSLFNGTDLTGWQGAVENYEVVEGAIRCKDGHGGVLHTQDEYGDFQVRLEFKLPPAGNNGLAIRYPGEGDPAYVGMCELQVLDTEHPGYAGLDPRQAHGSAYGMVPAARGYHRPTGEWNYQEVTVRGSTIKVELNGSVILDADLSTVTEFLGNSPHPGKDRPQGYFGFAGHSDPVEFRNIEIKRLDETVAAWPQFRGPASAGRPVVDAPLPDRIGPETNVVWSVELPPGHSSPAIHGDRIYLTAVRDQTLLTLGLDRRTGAVLWEQQAPHDNLEDLHQIGSYAQSSPATDGEHVVSFFGSSGLYCYDRDGTFLWNRPMGPFKNGFGAGSSPIILDGRVILCQDHDSGSFLAAYNIANGSTLWETDRSEFPRNYCTPVIWDVDGERQIVVVATLRAVGYDFDTGSEVWTVRGLSRFVCPTPVIGDDGTLYLAAWARGADAGERLVFDPFDTKITAVDADGNGRIEQSELAGEKGSDLERRFDLIDRDKDGAITRGEYEEFRIVLETSENGIFAIAPGGRGDATSTHLRWRYQQHVPFCASPLLVDGHLFGVKDGGILTTLAAATGEPVKTGRVRGNAAYYASPVFGDGRVFLVDEAGVLTIVSAAAEWEVLDSVDFGEPVYATPAIADGRIYVRTTGRLYCFGGGRS